MGTIPLTYIKGYPKIVMDPWINNWNSPDLTNEITVAVNEINSVMRWNSFDATTDGINLDLAKVKIPNINVSKLIQYAWK
tara:strand:+ start:75 stop:314 length:240 start_codon:yes stop_codon:yes gene_type:complete